jgi:signal transduction histidine kinase
MSRFLLQANVSALRGQLARRWAQVVAPFWLAPLFLGVALLMALLTQLVERGQFEPNFVQAAWPTPISSILVGVYALAWLLETSGLRWPRLLFAILATAPALGLLLLGRDTIAPMLPMPVVGWLAYTGTRRVGWMAVLIALFAILLPFLLDRNVPDRGAYRNLLSWTIGVLASWAGGYTANRQRQLVADLRAAQDDLARQAAAEERRRIAREVHDLIAHSLAITMLHLTGARYHMTRDPQRAAEALAQAEQLGRQSMADIRRTVGLLGSNGQAGVARPLPGADEIPDLVEAFTRAGLGVTYRSTGDAAGLPSAAGLELYRIAQEALSNVVKHAPGANVVVDLQIGEREVLLCVRDDGGPGGAQPLAIGTGLGIMGMRERAALLGGTLSAQPSGAGWLVECRFRR